MPVLYYLYEIGVELLITKEPYMSKTSTNPLTSKIKKEYNHAGRYEKHLNNALTAVYSSVKTFKRDEEDADKNKAHFLAPICTSCSISESTAKDVMRSVVKGQEILGIPKHVQLVLASCYPHSFNRLKESEAREKQGKK